MNHYYPMQPDPKKQDNLPIGRIIAIIVLFSIGLWPIAIFLIWQTFSKSKNLKKYIAKRSKHKENYKIYGDYVPYNTPKPPYEASEKHSEPVKTPPSSDSRKANQPVASETDKSEAPAAAILSKKAGWHTALSILGIALICIGSILSFSALNELIDGIWINEVIPAFLTSALYVLAGAGLFYVSRRIALRNARKNRFYNVIGNRKVMKLDDISATLGIAYPQMVKELQFYLDKGMFPGGYIDHARKVIVISSAGLDLDALECEKPQNNSTLSEESTTDSRSSILQQIREVNKRIEDKSVSEKVKRIESITSLILDAVKRDPAKEKKISVFMSYYLPTTLKILNSYEQFEEQDVRGENLQSAMRDIENILDHLVSGFERQLDLLFESDVLDLSSDISVLESMLAKDGLTDGDFTMPKSN